MTRLSESESLLREAVDAITVSRPSDCELVSRIAVFLDGEPETPNTDLVWEQLPNGEFAWLRADMAGPCVEARSCGVEMGAWVQP